MRSWRQAAPQNGPKMDAKICEKINVFLIGFSITFGSILKAQMGPKRLPKHNKIWMIFRRWPKNGDWPVDELLCCLMVGDGLVDLRTDHIVGFASVSILFLASSGTLFEQKTEIIFLGEPLQQVRAAGADQGAGVGRGR